MKARSTGFKWFVAVLGLYASVASVSVSAATLTVSAGANLQAALDAALPGDTVILQAGATWTGNFYLKPKTGSTYITVMSSRASELIAGKRVVPADAPKMARIVSPNNQGAFIATAGAHHWKVVGLEFAVAPGIHNTGLVRLGIGDATSYSELPQYLEVDRCYIHPDPVVGGRRGVAANGVNLVIQNSYISDWKADESDAQAVSCWQCSNVRIENNYLEGAGENVMFSANSNLNILPTGMVVRRNHIYKPLRWRTGEDRAPSGRLWTVKNLFELKAGVDVLIERNVLENSWLAEQEGYVFNLKASRNDGTNTPLTQNVTIQDNLAIGGYIGVSVVGYDGTCGGIVRQVTVRRNAFVDLGTKWGGAATLFRVVSGPSDSFVVEDNTFVGTGVNAAMTVSGNKSLGLSVARNLMVHGAYGVKGTGASTGTGTLLAYFTQPLFSANVFIGSSMSASYPAGTLFVPSVAFGPDGYTQYQVVGGVDGVALTAAIAGVR